MVELNMDCVIFQLLYDHFCFQTNLVEKKKKKMHESKNKIAPTKITSPPLWERLKFYKSCNLMQKLLLFHVNMAHLFLRTCSKTSISIKGVTAMPIYI